MSNQEWIQHHTVVSVKETAQMLGLAEQTLRNWISQGRAPFPTARVGRRRVIRQADIEAFLNAQFSPPRRRGRPALPPAPDAIGNRS